MIDKPKRKHEAPSPLAYWWKKLLFARGFEFETMLTPGECVDRLHAQTRRASSCLDDLSVIADITPISNSTYDFDIRIKRRGRGLDYTTARATGTIIVDGASGITIVRGDTRFGIFYHPFLWGAFGLAMTLSALSRPHPSNTFWIILVIGVCAFALWRVLRDHQHLIQLIYSALADEKSKRDT